MWTFESSPPMGGPAGEAYTTPAQGSGIPPADLLVRESIQNSVDAIDVGRAEKVRIEFRRESPTKKNKADFLHALAFEEAFHNRKGALPRDADTHGSILDTIDKPSTPLELLYISDHGTFGLFGDPTSNKSHFYRLLLGLGDGSKARESKESGGSFGFGKTAYAASSLVRTIIAYTVFDPKKSGGDGAHARLLGCCFLYSHTLQDQEYTGRGWFGIPEINERGQTVVHPYIDNDAHQIAESLGFSKRTPDDYGTSILVVDCPISISEIQTAVEKWWWPRIIDDELDVVLTDESGQREAPRPRRREDLAPFIRCYEMAIGRSFALGEHEKTNRFNAFEGRQLGTWAFKVLDSNSMATNGSEDAYPLGNSIALVRSLKMVVEYKTYDGLPTTVVGAFVADAAMERILRSSEPLTHDRWDPSSTRENGQAERRAVETLLSRLKKQFRIFARDAMPAPPPTEIKAELLGRILGKLLRPRPTPGDPVNKGSQDPFTVEFDGPPAISLAGSGIRTEGAFWLGLAPKADVDQVTVQVEVKCLPVEDTGPDWRNPIPVHLSCQQPDLVTSDSGQPGRLVATLMKETLPKFTFRSDAYDPDWSMSVAVDVVELVK